MANRSWSTVRYEFTFMIFLNGKYFDEITKHSEYNFHPENSTDSWMASIDNAMKGDAILHIKEKGVNLTETDKVRVQPSRIQNITNRVEY